MLILVRNSLHETLWVGGFKSQAKALFVWQGGKKTRNEGNKSEVGNMICLPTADPSSTDIALCIELALFGPHCSPGLQVTLSPNSNSLCNRLALGAFLKRSKDNTLSRILQNVFLCLETMYD